MNSIIMPVDKSCAGLRHALQESISLAWPNPNRQTIVPSRGTSLCARLIVAPHAAAAAPLRKGAVKDVQRAVVGGTMRRVACVAQVVPQPQPHRVPVIVAAHLHPCPSKGFGPGLGATMS